jgi:hypothetical protein
MSDQLFLLPINFTLDTIQPPIQVVLAEQMRQLFIILQRTLQTLLRRGILLLQIPYIPYSRLTTRRTQSTAHHSE